MIISGERGEKVERLLEGSEMCALQTMIEKGLGKDNRRQDPLAIISLEREKDLLPVV